MKSCPKCGNQLTDNQLFCPKCGTKTIDEQVSTVVDNMPQTNNKQNKKKLSTFKYLKGINKATFVINYMLMFFLLIYFVGSVFFYLNRNATTKINFVFINQMVAIAASSFVLIDTILVIIIFTKEYKKAQNKRNEEVISHLAKMISMIIGFCFSLGQIFLVPAFGVAVLDIVTLFICANLHVKYERKAKTEQQ